MRSAFLLDPAVTYLNRGSFVTHATTGEHRVEIPVMRDLLRISVAAYTTQEDVERLLDVLPRALTRRSPTAR
jgi:selenocysteine lyase/cysteine desulfurase